MKQWLRTATYMTRHWAAATLLPSGVSYSGAGEDLLVIAWLRVVYGLAPDQIRYCDIGANHPRRLNNTFALYTLGASGVLVEPEPEQAGELRKARPRDTVLNVGAAFDERRTAKLQRFTSSVFNTFSPAQADFVVASSKKWLPAQKQEVIGEAEIELVPMNDILSKHFQDGLHFLSIDAEGVDLPILQSIDFSRFSPKMICIEASNNFDAIMGPHGYELVARTPDNVIYRKIS